MIRKGAGRTTLGSQKGRWTGVNLPDVARAERAAERATKLVKQDMDRFSAQDDEHGQKSRHRRVDPTADQREKNPFSEYLTNADEDERFRAHREQVYARGAAQGSPCIACTEDHVSCVIVRARCVIRRIYSEKACRG